MDIIYLNLKISLKYYIKTKNINYYNGKKKNNKNSAKKNKSNNQIKKEIPSQVNTSNSQLKISILTVSQLKRIPFYIIYQK